MNIKILAYLVAFLLTASVASAWLDYTHQWICDQAGLSQYNCSIADDVAFQKKHPGSANRYHLCINNTADCTARKQAEEFFIPNPEISLHMWADSMAQVHWHNFGFEGCHQEFEDCVNSNLKFGNTNWQCSIDCTDLLLKEKFSNHADYNYMLSVVDYVKRQYAANQKKEVWYKAIVAVISIASVLFAVFFGRKHGSGSR